MMRPQFYMANPVPPRYPHLWPLRWNADRVSVGRTRNSADPPVEEADFPGGIPVVSPLTRHTDGTEEKNSIMTIRRCTSDALPEYCHDWSPGKSGCVRQKAKNSGSCPTDCLGDFTGLAKEWATLIANGQDADLGFCDGHQGEVLLHREGANLYVRHCPVPGVPHGIPAVLLEPRLWVPSPPSV